MQTWIMIRGRKTKHAYADLVKQLMIKDAKDAMERDIADFYQDLDFKIKDDKDFFKEEIKDYISVFQKALEELEG